MPNDVAAEGGLETKLDPKLDLFENKPKGPNVLLLGEMTAGKTHSLRSLIDLGYEVFYIPTEPGYEDLLGDIPKEKLKWHYVPGYGGNVKDVKEGHTFDRLLDIAKMINTTHPDVIQKQGGVHKENYTQLWDLLATFNDFVDDRTGQKFGDVSSWDHTRCLFFDGTSGFSEMCLRNTIGDKPFLELRDYTAVQFQIAQTVNTLSSRTAAMFVMTAHLEVETNPNTGARILMTALPGKALAPVFPRFFSDAIHCKMEIVSGSPKWTWNTLSAEVSTKARNLPLRAGLTPSFHELVGNWRKRVLGDKK